MKKVLVLLLVLVWCHAASAQKVTFRLHAAASYAHIPDYAEELLPVTSLPPGAVPVYQTHFSEKAGAKIGGSLGVSITPKLQIETGLQASLVRFQKNTTILYPDAGDADPVLRRWRHPEDIQTRPALPEPYSKAGNTAILYLDIPLAVRYNVYKFIDLKAGFTTSFLTYSERMMYFSNYDMPYKDTGTSPTWKHSDSHGRYGIVKTGGGLSKTLASFTTGITLKATRHVGFDLDYARYLTPIYTSQAEKHPHKYNLFNLGMSYAF